MRMMFSYFSLKNVDSMRKRLILFLILFIACTPHSFAQYFSTGQDPASMKWRQIKTKSYKIIYPSNFGTKAQYLANLLDLAIPAETITLHSKIPQIPIILHTRSTTSNGVTVWAPKRIEFFTCPPQDTYSEEWLEQLTLHEYRHAVQVSKMNRGFTKALYFLLGEQATGGILGLFVPGWFLEGDATVTETTLSNSGRGRLPAFEAPLRAQLLEKGIYSYDKATLGSYKTFTPDNYILGYHLVAKSREKYGTGIWDYTLDRVAKYPFMVVPFANGIKRRTGLSKVKFYKTTLTDLDSIWRAQDAVTTITPYHPVTHPNPKNYTSYIHPVHWNDDVVLALKSDNEGVDRFILVGLDGIEKDVFSVGNYQEESHSCANGKIVWSEYQSHVRWANKSFSIIRMYDLEKKKVMDLTCHSRYFSPMISPNGKLISAVRVMEDNSCFLDLLDSGDGHVVKSYRAPDHGLLITPTWSPDNSKLTYTLLTEKGKSIGVFDTANEEFTNYLPFSYNEISGPSFFYKNYLVFTGDFTGIDNLFAMDTLTRKLFQVTSARFASGDPDFSSDQSSMVYSEYGSNGLMIAFSAMDTSTWVTAEKISDRSFRLDSIIALQENTNIQDSALKRQLFKINWQEQDKPLPDGVKAKIYPVKNYRRGLNLFNPHSWAPASIEMDNLSINPGICLLSQNLLSTAVSSIGFAYDVNERTGKFYAGFSYQGWFPVIDLRYEFGKRAGFAQVQNSDNRVRFTWNESNMHAVISVPLNLTHGIWFRTISPSVGGSLIQVIHDKSTPDQLVSGFIGTLEYRLTASNYLKSNYQDVFPRWGQDIALNFRHAPFGSNDIGSIGAAEANFYFPGFFSHHGWWLYTGYQQRNDNKFYGYQYSGFVNYPRGIIGQYDENLASLSFNYKFPFARIDFSMGSILYFKRFKLNLFYDWSQGWSPGEKNIYQSTGAELTADIHLLRFPYPVEMGIRSIYFPQTNTYGWGLLYSISL